MFINCHEYLHDKHYNNIRLTLITTKPSIQTKPSISDARTLDKPYLDHLNSLRPLKRSQVSTRPSLLNCF